MELYLYYSVFIAWTGKVLAFFDIGSYQYYCCSKINYGRSRPGRLTPGKEVGWASGTVRTGAEDLADTGIRSSDRPARGELLYRLRCPDPSKSTLLEFFFPVIYCLYNFVWKANNIPTRSLHSLYSCIYLFPQTTIVSYNETWSIFNFFSTGRLL